MTYRNWQLPEVWAIRIPETLSPANSAHSRGILRAVLDNDPARLLPARAHSRPNNTFDESKGVVQGRLDKRKLPD
jgi:hypothetical protein